MSLATAGTAHAAVETRSAQPSFLVSCASTNVWLRVWFILGEDCYSGNGINFVNLTDVTRDQIIGRHTVCFLSVPATPCTTGPGTFLHQPPILSVREIEIRTP
jgi:hypothetical protein